MLIDFTVENYRSIHKPVTLSMERIPKLREARHDDSNIFTTEDGKHELLKTAVIYGANASGKSNLLDAIRFASRFVLQSVFRYGPLDVIPVIPFQFSEESPQQPSVFEFRYHLSGHDYRYGFEASSNIVEAEWLYCEDQMLFDRNRDKIDHRPEFGADNAIVEKTRNNTLFLSMCATLNHTLSLMFIREFFAKLDVIAGNPEMRFVNQSLAEVFFERDGRDKILQLLSTACPSIVGVELREVAVDRPESQPTTTTPYPSVHNEPGYPQVVSTSRGFLVNKGQVLVSRHKVKDRTYDLDFEFESEGTQKLLSVAGPVVDVLTDGGILVVDELDARLHPILAKRLVQMFHRENTKNAQLIFATHDTNLLSNELFRRDQIWFTEKNESEATELYSLADYGVRQDEAYERNYLKGRYGAIPFLGNLDFAEVE